MSYLRLLSRQWYRCPPKVCLWRGVSSEYWAVYKFFASQSLHNRIFFLKKNPAKQKTAQFFPFLFCFTRELNPYPKSALRARSAPLLKLPNLKIFSKNVPPSLPPHGPT